VEGEQFVYEKEPRDVESAAFIRECSTDVGKGVPTPTGKMGVWLDSPMIEALLGPGSVRKQFPGKHILFRRHGIDISKEPMLVYPSLHYQNGGLVYNANCETKIPGLFIAGEVGGGVHGENRLMGNSLLDVVCFGRIAGKSAAEYARQRPRLGRLSLHHVRQYHKELEDVGIKTDAVAPMLLPDYVSAESKKRQLTSRYLGTLR